MLKSMDGRRIPIRSIDKYNSTIVLVPLANHPDPAIVDAKVFDKLMTEGYSDQWTFNQFNSDYGHYGFVRCGNRRVHGRLTTVARLVTNANLGQIVRYRDKNPLNLRRSNLTLKKGNAKGAAQSQ